MFNASASRASIEDYLKHRNFALECHFAAMMADPDWREKAMMATSGEDFATIFEAFIEFNPDAGLPPHLKTHTS